MPDHVEDQPLAVNFDVPAGVDAQMLAHAILAFVQDEYGATVETLHEADGQVGRYVVHIDPERVRPQPQ